MAVKVKLTLVPNAVGDRLFSITESHWLPSASDLVSNDQAVINLANARLALCGGNIQMLSVTLSLFPTIDAVTGTPVSNRQANRILLPQGSVTAQGQQNFGSNTTVVATSLNLNGGFGGSPSNIDQPKSCLQLDLGGTIQAGSAKGRGRVFLAGIPDDIIKTGTGVSVPNYAGVPGWQGALSTYLQMLMNGGFAFLGTTRPPKSGVISIIDWSNEASGNLRMIFTIASNAFGLGQIVHIRKVRAKVKGQLLPNGKWKVAAVAGPDPSGNFSYTLKRTEGMSYTSVASDGTAELYGQSFYIYDGTAPVIRATAHKRGASAGAAHGRSRPRQRQLA